MEKEIPEDLTMIQPDPSPDEQAFSALLKNPPKDGLAISAPTTAKAQEQAIGGLQEQYLQDISRQEGSRDMDLDRNQSMFEDQNSVRARNQGEGVKGLKAIGGGILQGALIASEQLGYIGDLQGVYQRFMGDPEGISGNWWSDLMKESQEGLRETEAFKIYEDAPDENSLTSQIFKWSSLEGAISSAVGFGITGLGAAKLVSTLGSLGKFKELARFTDITMGKIKGGVTATGVPLAEATAAGAGMTGASGAFVGPLATSAMSNYFMGQMMATDTYNQILTSLEPMVESGEMTKLAAQKLAAKEAQDVVGLNMALTATAYIKFGGIFKRKGRIKGLVENPTALNQMKGFIKAGSPTAFTENVYQEMIQMEQFYDAGVPSEEGMSGDYWSRMTQLALSNRAMHAGALGVVGGPIQFALIQRPMMGKQIKSQREIFEKQRKSQEWQKELVKNYYSTFETFDGAAKEALIEGDPDGAEFIEDIHTLTELSKSIEHGTLAVLKKDIQDIMKMDPAKATEEYGYDGDFQETGQKFLTQIENAEKYLLKFGGKLNKAEIVQHALVHDRTVEGLRKAQENKLVSETQVIADIKQDLGIEATYDGKKFVVKRADNRFEGKSTAEKATLVKKESLENQSISDYLKNNRLFNDFKTANKDVNKYTKFKEDLESKIVEILSPEGQAKYAERSKAAHADIDKNLAEAVKNVEDKETAVKTTSLADEFQNVKNQKTDLTEAQIEELQTNYDAEVGETKVKHNNTSFTARDDNKVLRTYTPGQLLRTNDGRFFKVQNQAGAAGKNTKGKVTWQSMPVVIQTDEKGYMIKGTKPMIPDDHSFFRAENLIPLTGKDGKTYFPKNAQWGKYVKTDSILKPNDVKAQLRLVERANRGEVAGMRIPANILQSGEFAWLEDYNHHLLNLPFKEPYDVVYKLNDQGPFMKFVDVYKREVGKKDALLTRVARDSNLNYQALIDLIGENKSEITGKVIGHFSTRTNMVQHTDQNGEKVYSDLKEMRNMTNHLIGGKIILAQTTGDKYGSTSVARDETGKIYSEGTIMIDGLPRNIPYSSMTPGDTYSLILGPDNSIIPLALSSDVLSALPSNIEGGTSKVDDVVADWNTAIETWLKDELENEENSDQELRAKVARNNDVGPDRVYEEGPRKGEKIEDGENASDKVFRDLKVKILRAKIKEQYESGDNANSMAANFDKTIFKSIRDNYQKYTVLKTDENGEPVYDKKRSGRGKGKEIFRERYFKATVDVSKKSGSFVPAIRMRNPYDHTQEIYINIEDNAEPKGKIPSFYEVLGKQRMRASIDVLANPEVSGTQAANSMQDFIENQGFKIDVDTTTPFMGSSATMTVDNNDFISASKKAGQYKENDLNKIFKDVITGLESFTEEAAEARVRDFKDVIEKTITPQWKEDRAAQESQEEIIEDFKNLIVSLNLVDGPAAVKMLNEMFSAEQIPQDKERRYNELLQDIKDGIGSDNAESIAKGLVIIEDIERLVDAGEMTVRTNHKFKTKKDPLGNFTQPEEYNFEFGNKVYHIEHGEASFKTTLKSGMYKIVTPKDKEYVVYPGDTVSANGDRAELYRTLKRLNNQEEGSPEFKSLERVRNRLDAKIAKDRVKDIDTAPTVGATSMENILEDRFTTFTLPESTLAGLKGFGSTERTRAIADKLSGLEQLEDFITSLDDKQLSPKDAMMVNELFKESIPYTAKDLDGLIALAQEKSDNESVATFRSLKTIINVASSYDTSNLKPWQEVQYSNKQGEFVIKDRNYIVTEMAGLNISAEDLRRTFNKKFINKVGQAVSAEGKLRSEMFITTEPVKPPTNTTATKDPIRTPAQIFNKKQVTSQTLINLNNKVQPVKEDSAVDAMVELGADEYILGIVRGGYYNVTDLLDLQSNLKQFKVARMDPAPLYKEFVDKAIKEHGYRSKEIMEHKISSYIDEAGAKFKRGDAVTNTQEEFDSEVRRVKELLPQVPLEVVSSVTDMVNKYGISAIGAFDNGVQYIVNKAKKGTVFHEAFHAVADLYLTADEKIAMAKERDTTWNIKFEEELAEEFEKYVNKKPLTIGQKVTKFFKGIMDWFKGRPARNVVDKIFNDIVSKGYANKPSLSWRDNISPLFNSIEEYKSNLSKENSVLLQSLLDDNKIEIVC